MTWFNRPFLGPSVKELGGGGGAGMLDQSFISVLQKLLNGGGIGTGGSPNAAGTTGSIYSVLSDILKGADGNAGSAISKLLSQQQTRDINGLRSQFGASGGQAFGTPAAYAESNYRATAAPQITSAITQLQLSALGQLIPTLNNIYNKNTPQAQFVQNPGFLDQALKTVGTVASAIHGFQNPWGGGGGGGGAPAPASAMDNYIAGAVNGGRGF